MGSKKAPEKRQENPGVYAGVSPAARRDRAAGLLARLGLGDRTGHRPGQLSGGQQQRVSIARALMNGGEVILADEPTGALDSRSGEEVLAILEELNALGRTIVIVTHDMEVASRAGRIVEIRDGTIVSDRRAPPGIGRASPAVVAGQSAPEAGTDPENAASSRKDRETTEGPASGIGQGGAAFFESLRMALLSMAAHRLRTFLTMLGIIIGIAAVVSVVALGAGAQSRVLANIAGLGTNTLEIFAGTDMGDVRSGRIRTLVVADGEAIAREPYAAAVTPTVSTSATLRVGGTSAGASITGVADTYFEAKGISLADGRLFGPRDVASRAQVAVIDARTRETMFGTANPLGSTLLVGRVPVTVVGIVATRQGFGGNDSVNVYLPYTTVQTRILGSMVLRSITVNLP